MCTRLSLLCILELYLEELSDYVAVATVECQTDAFLDKPATPLFVPAKSGKDVSTQIEVGEVQITYLFVMIYVFLFNTVGMDIFKQVCVFLHSFIKQIKSCAVR